MHACSILLGLPCMWNWAFPLMHGLDTICIYSQSCNNYTCNTGRVWPKKQCMLLGDTAIANFILRGILVSVNLHRWFAQQ